MVIGDMLKFVLSFCITLGIMYLLGSFIAASFDITAWSPAGRFFAVIFGTVGAIACGSAMIAK